MGRFSDIIVKHRKIVITVFLLSAVIGFFLSSLVGVNYNMVDYLPDDAQSTKAISLMKEEFGGQMPNARVMIDGVTILQALDYKDQIAALPGVSSVSWLDDVVGREKLLSTPAEFFSSSILENYYKDGSALISLEIESGKEKTTVAALRELVGEHNAVAGDAANSAETQAMSVSEVLNAMAILVPVILLILTLSTTSWVEPLLFVAAIGVAVLINMGTNLFFGETSFITRTVSPVLQLAVSLDYAVFLLHSYHEYQAQYEPEEAMKHAMKRALSAIASSAATTVFGFLALMFMRFRIGSDLGANLVKGVLLSFVSVMVFLPALTLAADRFIRKTEHRKLVPDLGGTGTRLMKISQPFLIIAVIIAGPCFLAQSHSEFLYGMSQATATSRAGADEELIEERFGKENILALLVPRGDIGREAVLGEELAAIPRVTSVVSYAASVGTAVPPEYISRQILDEFYSEHYARIILYTDLPSEGEETFAAVRSVLDTAAGQYGESYLAGQSATLYDMKSVVSTDTRVVNLCAVIGIFLVLLVTYRSLSIPLFLLFTIETAIWLNLSFAYFAGNAFSFIGYLVISTVQLGSTVDYAILISDRYLGNRTELPKRAAMEKALGGNILAVLISAVILSTSGFTLAMTSSNPIISELGVLLGRGTVLSFLMVALVLPALLVLFDGVIRKTTLKHGFSQE
jgi:predicted RND superfamily exporter protein